MSSIPEEIYHDILLRLPVKSLLVCKCVCKNWYALITSSDFVNLHLHLTTQKNNPITMLDGGSHNQFYSISYDSLVSSVSDIKDDVIEMNHPFRSLNYGVRLFGSCNGLAWMWLFEIDGDRDLYCLWNPATREYKEIPNSPIPYDFNSCRMRAFGYDHKTGDYKLAVGLKAQGSEGTTLVQVYTLSSHSWINQQTLPYRFHYVQNSGVLVNGYLHWLAIGQDDSLPGNNFLLISLDIGDENFKEMQLPNENFRESKDLCMMLGASEGCLCVLVSTCFNGVELHFELWEMLDYGVQKSWTKRLVIVLESLQIHPAYFKLLWSIRNGEVLFFRWGTLISYDTKNGTAKQIIFTVPLLNAENYFESLVSLNSGTYVGAENH